MLRAAFVALLVVSGFASGQEPKKNRGNRLAHLDEVNLYYPDRHFAKFVTPQWVGEDGVEAVVVLAIDDMKDPKKYETFLRPILNRLKEIDGRAPVSIMTCSIDPQDPKLQDWLKEGLSLECHTYDHPCPFFSKGFDQAKATYDKCVDLLHKVPNNRPVAFRMPCCDSMNTPSPRFNAEIFEKTTIDGKSLVIDSSVFNVFTSADPELPKELVLDDKGMERFTRYLPADRSFVNTIENYPYPYVIGKSCWQFPCMTPSDWQANHLQKANNPRTVEDWKAALDCTVIKKGVFCLVFHPHGWIKNEQVIDFVEHAVKKHGKKVKFLTFRECFERLEKNAFPGEKWRGDERVRLVDLDGDGYQDVLGSQTWLWTPGLKAWRAVKTPNSITSSPLAVFHADGSATAIIPGRGADSGLEFWNLRGATWQKLGELSDKRDMHGVYRDIDGDGVCEFISTQTGTVSRFSRGDKKWVRRKLLPEKLEGARWLDLDGDGKLDLVVSNEREHGVYLFGDMEKGWRKVSEGKAGEKGALPMISREGSENGFWMHSGSLWWSNEDTTKLRDFVDRRSIRELLRK